MEKSIKVSIVIGAGILLAMCAYIYFSPFQTCMRWNTREALLTPPPFEARPPGATAFSELFSPEAKAAREEYKNSPAGIAAAAAWNEEQNSPEAWVLRRDRQQTIALNLCEKYGY